jgi:hypothetical protein
MAFCRHARGCPWLVLHAAKLGMITSVSTLKLGRRYPESLFFPGLRRLDGVSGRCDGLLLAESSFNVETDHCLQRSLAVMDRLKQ